MKEGLAIIKKKGFAIFLMAILMLGLFTQAFSILFGGLIDKIFSLGPKFFFIVVSGFVFYKFEKTRPWIGGAFILYFVFTSEKAGEIMNNIKWFPILATIGGVWLLTRESKKKKT
jgi:hypothetical protein